MKIVVIKSKGVIAPYVMADFSRAFWKCGHQVLNIDTSEGFNQAHADQVRQFNPDFAIGYNFGGNIITPTGCLFRLMKIPLVALHYDNPFMLLTDQLIREYQNYPEYYYSFIWDRYFLDIYKQSGLPNGFPIMLATDPENFHPADIQAQPGTLAFVGNIKSAELQIEGFEPLYKQFIETVIYRKVRHFEIPLLDICRSTLGLSRYAAVKQLLQDQPYWFWSRIYYTIHSHGSSILRYNILNSINDVPLHIYGGGNWPKGNVILHGNVPYGPELARVYQSYAVQLNISSLQLETAVNNRVFDVFAAKGFLLSDYKQDMELVFPDHWQQVTFRSLEELGSKGEYFLSHEKERLELVEELHRQVLKFHTYEQRVKTIIEQLQFK